MILCIRTDQPEAEISLYDPSGAQVADVTWLAHRQLADTLPGKVRDMLQDHSFSYDDLSGVVVFRGPGSFTGLRIGISVANTFAYAQSIPIVGSMGDDWIKAGLARLAHGENQKIALPEYGAEANITKPRK